MEPAAYQQGSIEGQLHEITQLMASHMEPIRSSFRSAEEDRLDAIRHQADQKIKELEDRFLDVTRESRTRQEKLKKKMTCRMERIIELEEKNRLSAADLYLEFQRVENQATEHSRTVQDIQIESAEQIREVKNQNSLLLRAEEEKAAKEMMLRYTDLRRIFVRIVPFLLTRIRSPASSAG